MQVLNDPSVHHRDALSFTQGLFVGGNLAAGEFDLVGRRREGLIGDVDLGPDGSASCRRSQGPGPRRIRPPAPPRRGRRCRRHRRRPVHGRGRPEGTSGARVDIAARVRQIRSLARSLVPITKPAMRGAAAMRAAFRMPSGVSIIAQIVVSAVSGRASSRMASASISAASSHLGQKDRLGGRWRAIASRSSAPQSVPNPF